MRYKLSTLFLLTAVIAVFVSMYLNYQHQQDEDALEHLQVFGGFNWDWEQDVNGRVVSLGYHGNRYSHEDFAPAISTLTELKELDLRGVRYVSKYSLELFERLPNLEILDIRETGISEEAVMRFKTACPHCKVLYSYRIFKDNAEHHEYRRSFTEPNKWNNYNPY